MCLANGTLGNPPREARVCDLPSVPELRCVGLVITRGGGGAALVAVMGDILDCRRVSWRDVDGMGFRCDHRSAR